MVRQGYSGKVMLRQGGILVT